MRQREVIELNSQTIFDVSPQILEVSWGRIDYGWVFASVPQRIFQPVRARIATDEQVPETVAQAVILRGRGLSFVAH